MNYLKGSKGRNTSHNFIHLQVRSTVWANWLRPPLKSMERYRKLHFAPFYPHTWREQGLAKEESCPALVGARCVAVCSVLCASSGCSQSWARLLPEISLGQLPHDAALHMGLCRAQYPEVLWLHQQLCRNPQVRFYSLYHTQWSFWS